MTFADTIVYDAQHVPQALGPLLAQGGEGAVYPLLQRPDVLLKRYHPQHLAKRGAALRAKVEAMRSLQSLRADRRLSWPLIHAFDAQRNWVGYCMYRAQGVPMFRLAHAVLYQRDFPQLDRPHLVAYLINLVQQVKALHSQGVMVGDYNLNNILCDPASEQITLIDCDSYQLQIHGQHYPCPVGSPDMTPREQHGKNFDSLVRTPQSEAFSLAIILFKALMLGRHPYDIVGGNDPVENLRQGDFPYGLGNKGIPKGAWYNIWSHMPHRLKALFIQTFTEGAGDPQRRATPDEWLDVLRLYQREMAKGWHTSDIKPATPKAATYRGSQSQA